MKIYNSFFFFAILLFAAIFRFSGINWDANQHLHPDERFLTMVANGISWPKTIGEYFDTANSPLNPHNQGFNFFVYGTFPLFFVKAVAEALGRGDYYSLTLAGRALSGLVDLGTLVLVFLITKRIIGAGSPAGEPTKFSPASLFGIRTSEDVETNFSEDGSKFSLATSGGAVRAPLLGALFYALMVLPIQLSHFFTVDPYLTFFLALSFFILLNVHNSAFSIWRLAFGILFLGLSFGLAVASKISALLFLPVIGMAWLFAIRKNNRTQLLFFGLLFLAVFYLTLRLAQPYLFATGNLLNPTLNPAVLSNWRQLKGFDGPQTNFPPGLQWIATTPLLPLMHLALFGLGPAMAIIVVASLVWLIPQIRRPGFFLFLFWIFLFLVYQSLQFAKPMRYFSPIYPALAVSAGLFASRLRVTLLLALPALLVLLLWPLAFLSIYLRPNTRVAASAWIFQNISKGSTLAVEHWDDPLPLCLPKAPCGQYTILTLPVFDPETPAKWQTINRMLDQADYVILASNRGYGAITGVPDRFPQTNRYYRTLFDGSLGFTKVAQFTSRPTLPIPFLSLCLPVLGTSYGGIVKPLEECANQGISIVDDYTDETFTVYDHAKVLIFQKRQTASGSPVRVF